MSADPTWSRPERTGWRDQEISARHRTWGFNCPAVDLDFLMVEYNMGKPVALVEYKHFRANRPNVQHATYRALLDLANASAVPFYLAFYWPDIWAFEILPINDLAFTWFRDGETLSERRYVERMYQMRGRLVELAVIARLRDELPGWDTESHLWDAEDR